MTRLALFGRVLTVGLSLGATGPLLRGQLAAEVESVRGDSSAKSTPQRKAIRLILDSPNALSFRSPYGDNGSQKEEENSLTLEELHLHYNADRVTPMASLKETHGIVELEPFVVGVEKIPNPSPLRETPLDAFIRTGTLAEHTGKKVTTQLWIKGDEGIMLRFSW